MMSRRAEVVAALLELLQEEVTEVSDWQDVVKGVKRAKDITGTISCDRVSYAFDAKGDREATAEFSIWVLDPNSESGVDPIADHIDQVLTDNPTLNRWATDSEVEKIIFGVAQGRETAGLACLIFRVRYDLIPTIEE